MTISHYENRQSQMQWLGGTRLEFISESWQIRLDYAVWLLAM
jgi:hypothetical protein